MLFKKLIVKFSRPHWETTITGSGMIRICQKTGRKEFRDTQNKKWVPFEREEEIFNLQQKLLYLNFKPKTVIWGKHSTSH